MISFIFYQKEVFFLNFYTQIKTTFLFHHFILTSINQNKNVQDFTSIISHHKNKNQLIIDIIYQWIFLTVITRKVFIHFIVIDLLLLYQKFTFYIGFLTCFFFDYNMHQSFESQQSNTIFKSNFYWYNSNVNLVTSKWKQQ